VWDIEPLLRDDTGAGAHRATSSLGVVAVSPALLVIRELLRRVDDRSPLSVGAPCLNGGRTDHVEGLRPGTVTGPDLSGGAKELRERASGRRPPPGLPFSRSAIDLHPAAFSFAARVGPHRIST